VLVRLARIAAALPPRAFPTNRLFFAIENYTLHLVLRDNVVDTDRTIQR
jgi:hypothetical protein